MNKKGQGALEYLLLIGGAVLVAAIVIALIMGTTTDQKDPRAMAKCAPITNCSDCVAKFSEPDMVCVAIGENGTEYDGIDHSVGGTVAEPDLTCTKMAADTTFSYCGTQKTV